MGSDNETNDVLKSGEVSEKNTPLKKRGRQTRPGPAKNKTDNTSFRKSSDVEKEAETNVTITNENGEGSKNDSVTEKTKKIALLDQPPVVEGRRSRKSAKYIGNEPAILPRRGRGVTIPAGRGIPLNRIKVICDRIRKLDNSIIKRLHKILFGKTGAKGKALQNVLEFRGFTFEQESAEYTTMVKNLNSKLDLSAINNLIYVFDINEKSRTKKSSVKLIVDFLMCPKRETKTTITGPHPDRRPKRKASKRNYFEGYVVDEPIPTIKVKSAKKAPFSYNGDIETKKFQIRLTPLNEETINSPA